VGASVSVPAKGLVNARISIQRASRIPGIPADAAFRKWIRVSLPQAAELTLRIVNAAEGRKLNAAFRGKDYATNVLTFVYHEPAAATLLGDIVICAPVVAREARAGGKALAAHYAHLTVHGVLHLAGFDHKTAREAKVMEAREAEIVMQLGFAHPYQPLT
jgi:probable rRNA maturation factor